MRLAKAQGYAAGTSSQLDSERRVCSLARWWRECSSRSSKRRPSPPGPSAGLPGLCAQPSNASPGRAGAAQFRVRHWHQPAHAESPVGSDSESPGRLAQLRKLSEAATEKLGREASETPLRLVELSTAIRHVMGQPEASTAARRAGNGLRLAGFKFQPGWPAGARRVMIGPLA
jgi:hypothetical protein